MHHLLVRTRTGGLFQHRDCHARTAHGRTRRHHHHHRCAARNPPHPPRQGRRTRPPAAAGQHGHAAPELQHIRQPRTLRARASHPAAAAGHPAPNVACRCHRDGHESGHLGILLQPWHPPPAASASQGQRRGRAAVLRHPHAAHPRQRGKPYWTLCRQPTRNAST